MSCGDFEKTVTSLAEARTYQDVISLMKMAFTDLGFSEWIYLVQMLESYAKSPAMIFLNVPHDWISHYLLMSYNHVDPIIKYFMNNNLPFFWDARADWSKSGQGTVDFMDDVRNFGFTGGLCIPLFSAQNTRGFINFIARTPSLDHLHEALKEQVSKAVFLLRYVHDAVLRIAMESGDSLYQNPLTPRQKEILLWVGEGLTSKAIADQLGMSFRTVEHHLAEVQRKLNVSNRQQAVTRAISLGFILPIQTPKDPILKLIF